ncbi:MAG: hypothetical protein EBS01_16805, partial [Verrucomicrobia bacterium]|nr:hypothetical protein [Verrucomicrobiota bacterium]
GYEVVASDLRVELGRRYHLVVSVSCEDHSVHFRLQDLEEPGAPVQKSVVRHALRGKFGNGASSVVVGGLNKRSPHQWDGSIEALRVVPGRLSEADSSPNAAVWKSGLAVWDAKLGLGQSWRKAGEAKTEENASPRLQAFTDLCQVLLNSNEFLHLH